MVTFVYGVPDINVYPQHIVGACIGPWHMYNHDAMPTAYPDVERRLPLIDVPLITCPIRPSNIVASSSKSLIYSY